MTRAEWVKMMQQELPVTFPLVNIREITNNLVAPGTLRNHLCSGTGPHGTYRHGKKIMLTRDGFVEWMANRLTFDE
jgi:hypothetical protein